jgi:hypothetical protein
MPKKLQQENKNKVPASQWRKWPDLAQRVFNDVYAAMEQNPALFVHPKTKKIAANQWGTVAWNAAWIAADATLTALKDVEKGIGYYKGEKP